MKRKNILIIIFCSIVIITCSIAITIVKTTKITDDNEEVGMIEYNNSDDTEIYTVHTFISDDIKANAEDEIVSAEFDEEITLSDLIGETENIAIVRIVSLDSSSAEFDQVVGKTYGKLIINTVIKGDLQEGTIIDYATTGGYLTIAEWEKYQPSAANEKRDYLRQQSGIEIDKDKTYIHLQLENNIDIEAGKTYLAYLNYNEDMEKYEVVGFEKGLMEINIEKEESTISTIDLDVDELKIKNNNSNEYESLKDYIEEIKS